MLSTKQEGGSSIYAEKKSASRKLHRILQRNMAAKNITAALFFVCVCLKAPHRMKPYELLPAQHRYYSNNGTLLSSGQTVKENRGEMEDTQRSPCILWELKWKGCLEMTRKRLKYVSVQKDCMLGAERDIQCEKSDYNWELGNSVRKFWKLIKNLLESKMC